MTSYTFENQLISKGRPHRLPRSGLVQPAFRAFMGADASRPEGEAG
jgi:hypothetical protein